LSIDKYNGLIKTYEKPFTAENHDALGPKDYIFAHFVKGEILPLTQ
jgi:branched-chain amino acid transport system substrate-binding protein